MKKKYTHGFIGIGKMAQVILESMLKNKLISPQQVLVTRRNSQALQKIAKRLKVNHAIHNTEVASRCQYLWLGIKPFQIQEVLTEIRHELAPNTTIISMLAGVSTGLIKKHLNNRHVPVIRLMPNTPAQVGEGMTGVYFTSQVSQSAKKLIQQILAQQGDWLNLRQENNFDALTGLSGSGPAFIYTVAQALIDGGKASGLNQKQARQLTIQTLIGAAAMLKQTQLPPQKLIDQVVSKGGTTEAGLIELKQKKASEALKSAVKKASNRSQQISKLLSR